MIPANTYVLRGANSKIEIVRHSGNPPNIKLDGKTLNDVNIEQSSFGHIASVLMDNDHNSQTNVLSVLLPPVNLDGQKKEPVSTVAIFSIHKTEFGGAGKILGQMIDYKIEPVEGFAESVAI